MSQSFKVSEPMINYKTMDDRRAFHLIEAIRQGISYSLFEKLVKPIPFNLQEWSSFLHLSERSMQRYKKGKGTFNQNSSERIVEISMLYKYGVEVFGIATNFNTWLDNKSIAMGNRKPKELLDSSFGISLIKDELTRISQGILA